MCLAVPVRVKEVYPDLTGLVELGGVERRVSLLMTPEAQAGDYVLIHTGYSISIIDEAEALETLRLLEEMVALAEAEEAGHAGGAP
jgi:hydrogenase expression/formation protein HypC